MRTQLPKIVKVACRPYYLHQPRSQGLRGETVTKTLVKFVLSFQNFGEKIACAVRHNRIQPLLQHGCVALRMRFFPQNFGTIKRILPGSSSLSHREGPGTEVVFIHYLLPTACSQATIGVSPPVFYCALVTLSNIYITQSCAGIFVVCWQPAFQRQNKCMLI